MKYFFLLFVVFVIILSSCNNLEENQDSNEGNNSSAAIDSTGHNMFWNNQYYKLEFDTAFAYYTSHFSRGCGPANIVYESNFTDFYSGQKFTFFLVGISAFLVDQNHIYYNETEARSILQNYGETFIQVLTHNPMNIGSVLTTSGQPYQTVFPTYNYAVYDTTTNQYAIAENLQILHYETFVFTEIIVEYNIKVTRPGFYVNLEGIFRAQ